MSLHSNRSISAYALSVLIFIHLAVIMLQNSVLERHFLITTYHLLLKKLEDCYIILRNQNQSSFSKISLLSFAFKALVTVNHYPCLSDSSRVLYSVVISVRSIQPILFLTP